MIALAIALLALAAPGRLPDKPIWLAVTRPTLAESVKPLAQRRQSEGFEAVISTRTVEKALADLPRRPAFLLLVGGHKPLSDNESWYLPARERELYRWDARQPRSFVSDAAWGDLDGDGIPDIPVGRIPALTKAQADLIVRKILDFERQPPSINDLRLPIWAGTPQYGGVTDSIITAMALTTVQSHSPAWVSPWAIVSETRHPLCGWPPDHAALFTQQLKQGALLGTLIGHGSPIAFCPGPVKFTADLIQESLRKGAPTPPLAIISCDCGNFAYRTPCLAESLVLMPGGSVAVFAATAESHPLTNYYSAVGILEELGGRETRLGSLLLNAQRRMLKAHNFMVEKLLIDAEGKLEENLNLDKIRRDQFLMYALLGDPATRLHLPERLSATVESRNGQWHWQAIRPKDATWLHVDFRPAHPSTRAAPIAMVSSQEQPNAEQIARARRAFQSANAALAFTPLKVLGADAAWEGDIGGEGQARLTAIGPRGIYVALLELKGPPRQE